MKLALVFLALAALAKASPVAVEERDALVFDAGIEERDPSALAAFEMEERDADHFTDFDIEERDPEAVAEGELQDRAEAAAGGKKWHWGTANPPKGVGLKCRSGASSTRAIIHQYGRGHRIKIICQKEGQKIKGNNVWNLISRGGKDCWVSDHYTKTGYKWIPGVPHCSKL